MNNITITLREDIADWLRIKADGMRIADPLAEGFAKVVQG